VTHEAKGSGKWQKNSLLRKASTLITQGHLSFADSEAKTIRRQVFIHDGVMWAAHHKNQVMKMA